MHTHVPWPPFLCSSFLCYSQPKWLKHFIRRLKKRRKQMKTKPIAVNSRLKSIFQKLASKKTEWVSSNLIEKTLDLTQEYSVDVLLVGRSTKSKCADRKSTRLNSSHANISYAVFCLKKKNPLPPSPPLALYRHIHLLHTFASMRPTLHAKTHK